MEQTKLTKVMIALKAIKRIKPMSYLIKMKIMKPNELYRSYGMY